MEPVTIHGVMDRLGGPVALHLDGRRLRVVARTFLMDRKIAALWNGEYWQYWRVELEDGRSCVVYRDLNRAAWFLEPITH